jgi:hypothetical protein
MGPRATQVQNLHGAEQVLQVTMPEPAQRVEFK